MPFYNLHTNVPEKILSTPAASRGAAIIIFGKELGEDLTLEDQGPVATYMMSEREENMGYVSRDPTIPVWRKSKA